MRPDFAAELRRALVDPIALVVALRLDEGMKRQPRGAIVRCPFHEERNASCSVRVGDDGTIAVKCHACGATGDALTLIAQARGLDARADFRAVLVAAAELANRYDILEALEGRRDPSNVVAKSETKKAAALPKPERDRARERGAAALVDLPELERAHPEGWRYAEERGTVAFALGLGVRFLPPQREHGAIVKALLERATREDLRAASVLRPDRDVLEWPEHRMLIPWRRRDGSIAVLQRRLLRREANGERKYQVQRGTMVDVDPFAAHAFELAAPTMPDADVIIVEGALDVCARRTIAMHEGEDVLVIGAFNVTAATLHDWRPFVRDRRVRVALDADKAGDANAPTLAAILAQAGANEIVRERPLCKDWNETLLTHGRRAA